VQRTLAVVLALLAVLLLAAVVWLLLTAAVVWAYRLLLRHRIRDELIQLSGEPIVRALAPKQVITALLSKTYGDNRPYDEVVVGVLGGEGIDPNGRDLTTSTRTTVDYVLRRIDRRAYELRYTATFSFKENVTDPRFAIFATCDPVLRDSIALACRLPLYEEWFIPNGDLFERSVDEIASSAHIGIQYTDLEGHHHTVQPTKVKLVEAPYRAWAEFLTFFREPIGSIPKLDTAQYLSSLRIFQFDLSELAEDHVVGSIRSMSLTSTSIQPLQDPFLYWQAPYPCYVEWIKFDVQGLSWDGEPPWLFRVIPFAFRSSIASGRWIPAEQLDRLSVRSWLLPGHGVALMWKPKTDDSTTFDGMEL
jgi:hypothetical protein